jgi:hypothetical protein
MGRLLYRACYNRAPYPARYMLIPSRQGVCLLHRIGRPVIYARDPAFMPRDMIQDCLDHVRLNTDISHSGRRRPAQIVVIVLGCASSSARTVGDLGSHVVCRSWYAHPVTK